MHIRMCLYVCVCLCVCMRFICLCEFISTQERFVVFTCSCKSRRNLKHKLEEELARAEHTSRSRRRWLVVAVVVVGGCMWLVDCVQFWRILWLHTWRMENVFQRGNLFCGLQWARARVGAAAATAAEGRRQRAVGRHSISLSSDSGSGSACATCQHLELDQFEVSVDCTVASGARYTHTHTPAQTHTHTSRQTHSYIYTAFEPGRKIIDVY